VTTVVIMATSPTTSEMRPPCSRRGQRVAADIVGAEREGEAGQRGDEAGLGVEQQWVVRCEPRGEEGGEAEQEDGDDAEQRQAVPGKAAPERGATAAHAHLLMPISS
jgi:hypothetical protein